MQVIGHIYNNYIDKFGIPRQSGMVDDISKIVLDTPYSNPQAVVGLEKFSHIWLLWIFTQAQEDNNTFRPTVRPPKLGGNTRVGVFATRSPYRPNNIGLSSVKLLKVTIENGSTVLYVSGADILNGTPIIDIKPYIPYADSHSDATGSFASEHSNDKLEVVWCTEVNIDNDDKYTITNILALDPRPQYINDDSREYKIDYGKYNITFVVKNNILYINNIIVK